MTIDAAITNSPVNLTHLFTVTYGINPAIPIGDTPFGRRVLFTCNGGHFEGPRLSGKVLEGGTDWVMVGADGTVKVDVDLVLETEDGGLIHGAWTGQLTVSPQLLPIIADPRQWAQLNSENYYFRVTPRFETGHKTHRWLNNIICVANVRFLENALEYQVAHVL